LIKKIGILTFWEFPEGMAPTTRILAYSKGLVANNVDVEIYSFRRIYQRQRKAANIPKSGVINKINYTYIHFFNNFSERYKFFRIIDEIILRTKLILLVLKSHRRKRFDSFLFSFDDNHHLPIYTTIFKLFNFPVFIIADEYPIPIRDFMQDHVPDNMILKYRKNHECFAGRILMSEALRKFYDENISKKPTFILNTIIDSDRFLDVSPYPYQKSYICYMGNMGLNKDNVDNIIRAFALIESSYPDLELHLYGTPNEFDKRVLLDLIENLKLKHKVFFKGRAKYNQVPSILSGAKILVNSQPITKRAEGGFPTKLGEYLLSGKPSIFTDSGDISKKIKNNEHAFIVKPEDELEYSNKMIQILENYENALTIGNKGRQLILDEFDSKKVCSDLISFMSSFTKS
jgi:glycosyltransferase involved in cell wall biosynthesis